MQSGIEPVKGVWFFINPALNFSRADKDITFANVQYNLKGNQLPMTPQFTIKAGGIFSYLGHSLSPIARYIGSRYGDIQNNEKVDGYFTADVKYEYNFSSKSSPEHIKLYAQVLNIFDQEYVSYVAPATMVSDTPTYYVGAPTTYAFGLEVTF